MTLLLDQAASVVDRWRRRRENTDSAVTRCEADELLRVDLTVNGRPATVHVAPRVTLADALRDHLGLTGTHLGCEHGVCGLCTVMVDGDAARSCLILACQVDGSEIVTVEGMGTPTDLHPLQESFGAHHALQCGFCTPGQIMSAYDLLSSEPGIEAEELPDRLSGVLCRCTGYRNIVDAVADIAEQFPQGVPGPRNCGHAEPRLPRASLGGPGTPAQLESAEAASGPADIAVPSGEPTAIVVVDTRAEAPIEDIWEIIEDTQTLATCLPGAEIIADFGDDQYKGRMRVSLGPVRLAFLGDVKILERDETTHRVKVIGQAADASSGDVAAVVDLTAESRQDGGTDLRAVAELHMVGRIAQFGRGLVNDVSTDMFHQFAANIDAASRGEAPVEAAPASALSIMFTLIRSRIRTLVRRVLGRN
ncbi:xanthine dehydrogenase family Fe-S subunit [Aeromicrobium piscarium]|uniref:2Fe-2S iron-sulfur cluster binding domain-containing protein n=1 Tax=Aeromicrobium piscarium TaxID=2590901 RepID=A0A554SA19_9ACTN|nr:2Fe-2S iron-sulfur cluster-binding protein [Aeromicrobium piscarium]TSD63186.1 2Fe-2S iron-sulfur cluster binding domain-containing protein [Aeromicrobium piscarium]